MCCEIHGILLEKIWDNYCSNNCWPNHSGIYYSYIVPKQYFGPVKQEYIKKNHILWGLRSYNIFKNTIFERKNKTHNIFIPSLLYCYFFFLFLPFLFLIFFFFCIIIFFLVVINRGIEIETKKLVFYSSNNHIRWFLNLVNPAEELPDEH